MLRINRVKLLILLCVTCECNGHYPTEPETIVVVVEEGGNNRYPVQNGYGNRYPYNNNYNNVPRPGYNYNQGQWNGNYQNYRQQRPRQPPREDEVIVVVVEEDPGKNGPKTNQNVYGNLYNNPQRPYNQDYGNHNYGNPQNNYQTPNQGHYQMEKTTEVYNQGNYGDTNNGYTTHGNVQPTTTKPTQETRPTFESVENERTENPAKQTTPKDGPSLVPLNPNEYVYGGDKITINAPKRETDKNEHKIEDSEKDEDLDIDIRTLN